MIVYGYLLLRGAQLLSNGSELLLEVISPGIIGGSLPIFFETYGLYQPASTNVPTPCLQAVCMHLCQYNSSCPGAAAFFWTNSLLLPPSQSLSWQVRGITDWAV